MSDPETLPEFRRPSPHGSFLLASAGGVMMRLHDGRVDHQPFKIGFACQGRQHVVEHLSGCQQSLAKPRFAYNSIIPTFIAFITAAVLLAVSNFRITFFI